MINVNYFLNSRINKILYYTMTDKLNKSDKVNWTVVENINLEDTLNKIIKKLDNIENKIYTMNYRLSIIENKNKPLSNMFKNNIYLYNNQSDSDID